MQKQSRFLRLSLMSGLVALLAWGTSYAQTALSVTISQGFVTRGTSMMFSYPANSAAVTGGSGSFTYLWTDTNDGFGTWSNGSGPTFGPVVMIPVPGNPSLAKYMVTVTDSITGETAVSNVARYLYTREGTGIGD